jgi:L-threonylcarbamoyladenylate synthase
LKTKILKVNKNSVSISKIKEAAEILRNGGLVAFPTETVYGLGANALDPEAVKGIYAAKGRPSDNPLIVHIGSIDDVRQLTGEISDKAYMLMKLFWPGPLTLIFSKTPAVPEIVTAGLDTVAVRMPDHPVALSLLKETGLPIAAPSANLSGRPSPTDSMHVIEDLSGRVEAIIDSGRVKFGVESTVLDITCEPPVILRPGAVTLEQLRDALGEVTVDPALAGLDTGLKPKAPGMKYRHYSPKAEVIIVRGRPERAASRINSLAADYKKKGLKVGILATDQTKALYMLQGEESEVLSMGDRDKPETIASNIFRQLRELDEKDVGCIFAEAVSESGIGLAIMNRMTKAASYNIIDV